MIDEEVSRIINVSYANCRAILEDKKEFIEKLAERLLQNEVLNLPDILEIMGERPFPMKESVAEYLHELQARSVMDAKIAEEEFTRWIEAYRKDEGNTVELIDAIEKDIKESVEKGEKVEVYGRRIMDAHKKAKDVEKAKDLKFDLDSAEQAAKEEGEDKKEK